MVFCDWVIKGDWATHEIEHAVSAVYDIPHAGGLATLFPNWMRYNVKVNPERFAKFGVNVFRGESRWEKWSRKSHLKESIACAHSGHQLVHRKRLRLRH